MLRGAITLFRTMTAGLLMLAALVVFGTPAIAHAHGTTPPVITAAPVAPHGAVFSPIAAPAGDVSALFALVGPMASTAVASTAPASPADDDGCGGHGGGGLSIDCCFGAACAAMHGGLTPVDPSPLPRPAASATLMPAHPVREGIGTLPAIKPPRLTV